ncbi:hypothetical protein [Bradyrhizobium diazoefficiens]|uniref:RiboL-PSP-HEPN domain-containing protein n=1 Tax=Bradyrhizobium diazoefficiens TaxID=1355477 RepID=A0A809ZI58_9BRAD|nr:hypothetical protein [Bradyrhizobium diazoefficiens]WLA74786.1 hypothetical protein QIH77_06210 [Bradyrhizobium diazoefficiens]BCE25975.1 hypothetical protein XF1B_86560 [Bradyrhizobium diazoefficiens]BCE52232.1 hypothetical protein XF4B_85810 [Bradyrhizobium diazoefficiens]BCE95725.1 hypothetical protein XF10B_85230 [Bradyrhizobium diazoefficiens]BCF30675.1 hypothetical protein XF14B_86270 [Bradyrhizobium diazoefficiens]
MTLRRYVGAKCEMSKASQEAQHARDTASATLYTPRSAQVCSKPLSTFINEYDELVRAFFFTIMNARRIDEMRNHAARALAAVSDDPDKRVPQLTEETFLRVREFSALFSRNLVVGMANNFFSYISESLQLVLQRKPEVLRSSEKLTNEEVLQFSDMSELVAYMADKKVNDLAYGGLKGLEDYVRDRLGEEMFSNSEERTRLTILAELRNIHTHNRGLVNEVFLKRVGRAAYGNMTFELGKLAHAGFEDFAMLSRNAIEVAVRLDENLASKFGIVREPYRPPVPMTREAPTSGAGVETEFNESNASQTLPVVTEGGTSGVGS